VLIVDSKEQVAAARTRLAACAGARVVAQEFIPGPDTHHLSVAVCLDRKAEVVATFTARKRRQGNRGAGVGTYVESFQDAEAEAAAVSLLQDLKYVGVAEVELKRHAQDGRPYVIEVNPRLWTQVGLPAACGLNFPLLVYQLAAGLPVPAQTLAWRRVLWQDLWDDFYWTFRHGGYSEGGDVSRFQWLGQSWQAHVRPYFTPRDPGPSVYRMWQVARQFFPRFKRHFS
jgi:predicted ATP-grasp superfamily ATP-dependent carboligase